VGEWIIQKDDIECEDALFYRFREGAELHLATCNHLMSDFIDGIHHKTCLRGFKRGVVKRCPFTHYLD